MSDTQPESTRMIGALLGNYRLDSELGSGGMGSVYRASHVVLGRPAAVKILRSELCDHPEHIGRFVNEAKAASAIRHPGIVEVFDFGHADDGRAYLVMEFLDGESLARRIQARGRLPEAEAAQIARGIASALGAAHGRGIIHRDLKPDNIVLVGDPDLGERPKLLDFGIAKLVDLATAGIKQTQTGALMGTPLYMAPEQARAAGGIDHRADLYSIGCMLYEMLVGEPPFLAVGAGEIIALQLFGKVQPPSARVPGISAKMDAIVLRLLEKEPQDRFASAAELAAALGEAKPDAKSHDKPHEPGTTAAPTKRRTAFASGSNLPIAVPTIEQRTAAKTTLPLLAAAILLVLAGVGITIFLITRSGDAAQPPIVDEPATPVERPAVAPPAAEPSPPAAETPPAPPPAPTPQKPSVKKPTSRPHGPTTDKGSPIYNGLD